MNSFDCSNMHLHDSQAPGVVSLSVVHGESGERGFSRWGEGVLSPEEKKWERASNKRKEEKGKKNWTRWALIPVPFAC